MEGQNFPLEAHFVHASKDGELAVVAVLFEKDDRRPNKLLRRLWAKMPSKAGDKKAIKISGGDIFSVLPRNKSYYRFSGSLTTPPCSEGVRWLVIKNYATVSSGQVEAFLDVMHHENNRPIQPINARRVMR